MKKEEAKNYILTYEDANGDGYGFPCDAQGNILWANVYSPETTRRCLAFVRLHPERWVINGEVVMFDCFGQEIPSSMDWEGEEKMGF